MTYLTATKTEAPPAASEHSATEASFVARDARAARAVRLPETLNLQRIHDAYAFIARLHLISKDDDATTTALGGLRRIVPAARWMLYRPHSLKIASEVRFELVASYPPRPPGNCEARLQVVAAPETEESGSPNENTTTAPEYDAARESAREAFSIGNLVRCGVATENLIALPLVSDAQVAGVLVGARGGEEAVWTDEEAGLLQSLALPFAAWLDNRRQASEVERLLLTDDLTKLRNPRYLRETLISEIKRARRYNTQVAVLFLDLDNFKNVNDEHGHLVGSHALIEASEAILGGVRNTDTVTRYGGDEFVVVLPDTTLELAEQVAERIRYAIATRTFTGGRRLAFRLTASFGVASYPAHAQSPQQLIAAADAAMYRAKAMHKNCVHTANSSSLRFAES